MKKVLMALGLLAVGSILIAQNPPKDKMPLPRPAPELGLKDTQGKQWTIAKLEKDKVYMVEFWATWCGTCKEMAPMIEELVKEERGEHFEMLSVSIDTDPRVLAPHLKAHPINNPVLIDRSLEAAERWKAEEVPAFFLVKNGQIVGEWVGKVKKEDLQEAIRRSHAP